MRTLGSGYPRTRAFCVSRLVWIGFYPVDKTLHTRMNAFIRIYHRTMNNINYTSLTRRLAPSRDGKDVAMVQVVEQHSVQLLLMVSSV